MLVFQVEVRLPVAKGFCARKTGPWWSVFDDSEGVGVYKCVYVEVLLLTVFIFLLFPYNN